MSYVFSVGTGSLPEVTVWEGNVYACVWLLPFMTLTAVNNCGKNCKVAVSPCLKHLPPIPTRSQLWHCRVAPSQLRLPSCAWHPKQGQRTDPTWRSGNFSGWQQAAEGGAEELRPLWWQVASYYETKLPSPDSVEVQHINSLKTQQ